MPDVPYIELSHRVSKQPFPNICTHIENDTAREMEMVPFGQVEAAHRDGAPAPARLDGPRRQQEEEVSLVLMRVHPAAMKPRDEMRRLRLLHRCFLK